jgi:hypothetical protein
MLAFPIFQSLVSGFPVGGGPLLDFHLATAALGGGFLAVSRWFLPCRALFTLSRSRQSYFRHAEQVVSRRCELPPETVAFDSLVSELAASCYRLVPAEDLFNPLANTLAQLVTGMMSGTTVQNRSLTAGYVRRDSHRAATGDEILRVVVLISADCDPSLPRHFPQR